LPDLLSGDLSGLTMDPLPYDDVTEPTPLDNQSAGKETKSKEGNIQVHSLIYIE
jgi:hypothetical protein